MMRKSIFPAILVGIILTLALMSAGTTHSAQTITPTPMSVTGTPSFSSTITPSPTPEDRSEVGSTDGIVVMGFVTALIIILPIMAQRKSWRKAS